MIKVGILTISDKGSMGEREDKSGEVIKCKVRSAKWRVESYKIVPDEKEIIKKRLIEFCDKLKLDLVLTTGGTGLSLRDVTPEATSEIIDREVPGIAEVIRFEGMKKTKRAMLSRAVAGIRKRTLIVNLPGSPKGVRESLDAILEGLEHGIKILKGEEDECGIE